MKTRDLHFLIAESAGRCNCPKCKEKLFVKFDDETTVTLGEFCHIIGKKEMGPRGKVELSQILKEDPQNLIFLCAKHHKIIDQAPHKFPPEKLRQIKESHTKWVNDLLTGLPEAHWTLLIHKGNIEKKGVASIDESLIIRELYNKFCFVDTQELCVPEFLVETKNWIKFKDQQEIWWRELKNGADGNKKFVICSINFIPLAIHLGYLLGGTCPVEIFQYHQEEQNWDWKPYNANNKNLGFYSIEMDEERNLNLQEIALSISISAEINDESIIEILGNKIKIVKIRVDNANRLWLQFKEQLVVFQSVFIKLIDSLKNQYVNLARIHLFYAGPTPIAFKIGSSINYNMHPQFAIYNFNAKLSPNFSYVYDINDKNT